MNIAKDICAKKLQKLQKVMCVLRTTVAPVKRAYNQFKMVVGVEAGPGDHHGSFGLAQPHEDSSVH